MGTGTPFASIKPMLRFFYLLMIATATVGCNQLDTVFGNEKKAPDVTYSYACLDSALGGSKINRTLGQAGDLIRDLAVSEDEITDSLQTQYGRMFHAEMQQGPDFKLSKNKSIQQKLNGVLQKLLAAREKPSDIGYAVHLLEDTTVNAYTFGGQIYITRAMLNKCASDEALLYAIIGHEVGHSEMGHIKATLQDLHLSAKVFGEQNAQSVLQIKNLLTASFNQKNELEADYYGINLTNNLGYDVCTAVAFWKEMASNENRYSQVEDFFRTHPFSELRAECLTAHIRTNFDKACGSINRQNALPQVVN